MASDYETALEFLGALTVLAQPIDEEPYLKVYGFAYLDEEGMFYCKKDSGYEVVDFRKRELRVKLCDILGECVMFFEGR